jgi:hypothetical protein
MKTNVQWPSRARLNQALFALAASLLAAGAARAADSSPPQLNHTPVTKAAPGPLKISARITDESKIFPQIFMRAGNASAYEPPVDLKKVKGGKDTFEVTITARPGLEYYLECYDEYGNGPARSGSPDQPFKVELAEEASAGAAAGPARAAPWLKGSAAEQPAPERKVAAPAPPPDKPAPSAAAPTAASSSAASDMVAAVEAASPRESLRESARPAPAPEKPQERMREPAPEAAAEKHPAPAHSESLRERPLSTSLEGAGPIGAEGALWRSLLLPGFGQFKTDRPVRGAIFGGAAAAGVITTVVLAVRANQANNILDGAPVSVRGEAQDQAERYARARNVALGLTALLWLGQAAEAYFAFGSHD